LGGNNITLRHGNQSANYFEIIFVCSTYFNVCALFISVVELVVCLKLSGRDFFFYLLAFDVWKLAGRLKYKSREGPVSF